MMRKTNIRLNTFMTIAALAALLGGCSSPANDQRVSNAPATSNLGSNRPTNAEAVSSTCTPADDEQIKSQIRILIDGDKDLYKHRMHINFHTKYCKVSLRGWVDTWEEFQKLYDRVNNAGGVRSIDISGFKLGSPPTVTTECTGDTYKCGEICILKGEDCTIPTGP